MPSHPPVRLRQLSQQLQRGEITATALCEASLKAIRAQENSAAPVFLSRFDTAALESAQAIDRARAAGQDLPAFAGIPFAAKDLFDIEGCVTGAGAVVTKTDAPATRDADVILALRQAGLVLIGTTNMTEFAFSGLGINPHYGTPESACWPGEQRAPGGSSSGAAVALALGMVPMSLGTDTAGSCRIPAAWNGVVGYKPSQSRQSRRGAFPLSPTLDVPGPLAHSVDCCRVADALMRGESPGNATPAPLAQLTLVDAQIENAPSTEPVIADAYQRILTQLSNAGSHITSAAVPLYAEAVSAFLESPIAAFEAWHVHRDRLVTDRDRYDPNVAARLVAGQARSQTEHDALLIRRQDSVSQFDLSTPTNTFYLMPTTANMAPTINEVMRDAEHFKRSNLTALTLTSTANYLDACAITIPIANGIGLSVMGPNGRDSQLLNTAEAIEEVIRAAHDQR